MIDKEKIELRLSTLFSPNGQKVQQLWEHYLNKIQKRSSVNGKYENTLAIVAIKNMEYLYIQ